MVDVDSLAQNPGTLRSGPSASRRLVGFLLILAVFAVVGPLVGTIVVAVFLGLIGGTARWIAQIPGLIILAVVTGTAHVLGGIPAVVAGIIIGLKQGWFGGAGWLFALGAGALVGLGTEIVLHESLIAAGGSGLVGMFFAAATLSTLACWRIVKAWSFLREANP